MKKILIHVFFCRFMLFELLVKDLVQYLSIFKNKTGLKIFLFESLFRLAGL